MNTKDKIDIGKLLNEIDKNINDQMNQISEETLEVFFKQSVRDTKEIFKDDEIDFRKVSYVIYRSYILGTLIEKITSNNDNRCSLKIVK